MNSIGQGVVSFLSSFKAFFFFILAFLIFGSAFLFLSQPLCEKGWLCSSYLKPIFSSIVFNFDERIDIVKFFILSYIVGLLLYEFSRLIFKGVRLLDRESNEKERPNDIDIYIYLESHELARDIYMLQIFYSSIARLLLGTVGIAVILFSTQPMILYLLSVLATFVFLIWLNRSADSAVHALGKQIKDIIENGEYPQKKKVENTDN